MYTVDLILHSCKVMFKHIFLYHSRFFPFWLQLLIWHTHSLNILSAVQFWNKLPFKHLKQWRSRVQRTLHASPISGRYLKIARSCATLYGSFCRCSILFTWYWGSLRNNLSYSFECNHLKSISSHLSNLWHVFRLKKDTSFLMMTFLHTVLLQSRMKRVFSIIRLF